MNIVFFGSGAFGLPTLARLAASHRIAGIVSQPDRPAGRGGRPSPTPVARWAAAHLPGVPLLRPERASDPAFSAVVRALPADAWVVIAFGQKLPRALLGDRWAINLHASLLPRWRGAAPINAAVLAGDPESGNSVITLADRMDAGLILAQARRPIGRTQTAGELHDLLAADGPDLVDRVLDSHARGTLRPTPQDESAVSIAPKLSRADGWIDPAAPADECRRRVNGLSPWPGVTADLAGEPLRLLRADSSESPGSALAPGTVSDPEAGLIVCGDGGTLRLLEVQAPGRRPMPWADFTRGRRLAVGDRLRGGPPC